MSAIRVVQAAHTGAAIESDILDVIARGPLPLHALAERAGHSLVAVECVLRYLRRKGAVVREPGPDGVYVWRPATRGPPA